MISTTAEPKRVTYVAREMEVKIASDLGSGRVSLAVNGEEITLSAESAGRISRKLREAVIRANTP